MALGSKSTYFIQQKSKLEDNRKLLLEYLKLKGINSYIIARINIAYLWFCQIENKHRYDGATWSQDLYDIDRLDAKAMFHDYLYIYLNAYGSKKTLRLADFIYIDLLKKMSVPGIYIDWQKWRLFFLREILNYAFINRTFRGKRKPNDSEISYLTYIKEELYK